MTTNYSALTNAIILEENSSYPNNPGALMDAAGNPVQFPNLQAGIDSLNSKIGFDLSGASTVYSPNESLTQFENTYTGGDPNAANNIASMLGVSPSTPVGQLNNANVVPSNTFWNRIKNWFQNAYGNPDTVGAIGGSAQVGTGGTATGNPATQSESGKGGLSHIAIDAVAILLGLILIAISVVGLSKVQETAAGVARIAAA